METRLDELQDQVENLMMKEGSGATKSSLDSLVKGKPEQQTGVEGMVQKGEQGEQGKRGGLGGFIQNTTKSVKNIAGKVVKSTPQYKLFNLVKENKENIKKITAGAPQVMTKGLGKSKKEGGGLWDKVKGVGSWIGGGIKGMIDTARGKPQDNAKSISQPPKGGGGQGGGGASVSMLPMMGKRPPVQSQHIDGSPANKVPSLLAMDMKNLHTPYAKSTFNIVDAL